MPQKPKTTAKKEAGSKRRTLPSGHIQLTASDGKIRILQPEAESLPLDRAGRRVYTCFTCSTKIRVDENTAHPGGISPNCEECRKLTPHKRMEVQRAKQKEARAAKRAAKKADAEAAAAFSTETAAQ